MVKIEFKGTVLALIEELSAMGLVNDNVECVFTAHKLGKTLEQRALDAARPHMNAGKKITAIKAVREVTNLSLKEGKDFVESKFPIDRDSGFFES